MRNQHLSLYKLPTCLSACLPTSPSPLSVMPVSSKSSPRKIQDEIKKYLYIEMFFKKKVSALASINDMQLWIEWPHNSLPSVSPFFLLRLRLGRHRGWCVCVCVHVCVCICVSNSFVNAFLNTNPPCTDGNGGLWQRQGSFTVQRAEC